ncbi:MAG: PHP domain-containing protein [Dehalococcoidales bacterium]|nr:PHP domain-containing protein [Dehalococcoidales bacterium]
MLKADFHIHTKYSMDCHTEPENIVKRCQKLGINCIAVSDHDAVEGALKVKELAPFKVIVAEEVLTFNGEVMGMFLKERIASGITLEKAIASIKEQGGLVSIPHPFDPIRGLRLNAEAFEKLAPQIDLIEVFNARCAFGQPNVKAREYAKKHHLPGSAGSDAHTTGEIGNVYVTLPDFNSPQEFLAALREAGIQGKRSSPFVHVHTTIAKIRKIF